MNRMVLSTGLGFCLLSAAALAGPENVAWPGDYRSTFSQFYEGDRTANGTQVIRVFANQTALEGVRRDGKPPHGSVLVGELYSAKLDAAGAAVVSALGRRVIDKPAAVVVMQRGAGFDAEYPDALKVGDWEFAVFKPGGARVDKDVTGCRQCHHPIADKEFLFTYEHLPR